MSVGVSPAVRSSRTPLIVAGSIIALLALGGLAWWMMQGDELATLKGHAGVVRAVAFSPDGTMIASAGDDGTVRLWECATNLEVRSLQGHEGKVLAIAFGTAPLLASVGDDKTVRLWDWKSGTALSSLTGPTKALECVAVSPDGSVVAAAGVEGIIFLLSAIERA